jgi:L-gulono-1,4-lactone dehydrogenase
VSRRSRIGRGNGGHGNAFRAGGGWRNWAGNQRTDPARTIVARDTGEVVDAVKAAARDGLRVKAIGSGHSFTAIAVPDGVAILVPAHPVLLRVDDTGLSTVPAGMTLRTLNALLWDRGWALPNLGDIDAQTVAGAISTGTHGTGATHYGLATQVRGLELVQADGSVLACSSSENADVFAAARVGLGALGIIVTVTLQAVPAFRLHAIEAALPLDHALDVLAGDDDHVEFYWFPHTDIAATKRNNRTDAEGPARGKVPEWVGDELFGNGAFALACRVGASAPRLVPSINRVIAGQFAAAEYVDRCYRVFTSPRRVRFLEMEYAVPREALPEAFAGLRRAVERHGQAVTFPVEVRIAAADDIPLSTASGRDTAYVAVHVHRGEPHETYFGAVEAVMRALDGRPHWGKLHTRAAADLRSVYPDFDAFVALRDRLDPERRFGNAYLERVLG